MMMNSRHLHQHHRHGGQALTEFLVVAIALIPLFLLIPVIAKYQDIAHAIQMASRYAAFDALVRNDAQNTVKPIAQLQDEVRRRFFSNSNAVVKTNDVAGDFSAHQNQFWRTPDDKSLITNFTDIGVSRSGAASSDSKPFSPTYGHTGIGSASVNVRLANLPSGLKFYEPFDKINLSLSGTSAVLVDGWSGKNPSDVQSKFASLVPGTWLLPPLVPKIDTVFRVVEPGIERPKLGQLDFWQDVVPSNRLVNP